MWGILVSKIVKIRQLFLNLQPIIWVDVFFWVTVYICVCSEWVGYWWRLLMAAWPWPWRTLWHVQITWHPRSWTFDLGSLWPQGNCWVCHVVAIVVVNCSTRWVMSPMSYFMSVGWWGLEPLRLSISLTWQVSGRSLPCYALMSDTVLPLLTAFHMLINYYACLLFTFIFHAVHSVGLCWVVAQR